MYLPNRTLLLTLLLLQACGSARKIETVRPQEMAATLALSRTEILEERKVIRVARTDTLSVRDEEGRRVLIMKAVRDEASGEMVATDVLDAAVITARFRNVAERHGRVDLRFEVIVPAAMQDTRWQLRFYPELYVLGDSLRLEPVLITGQQYRKNQLRGYEQYDRFLRSIITDSTRFIDLRNLEIFIRRNIPRLYELRNETRYVSDEEFHSYYGVTQRQALRHYTNSFSKQRNQRRKDRRAAMYAKYVKAPIVTEGIRLDTVLQNLDGDFVYHYTQTLQTRPKLRKADIVLSGDIYESDRRIYSMARSQPLTFYISSMSTLVDGTERYLTRVLERRADAHTACYVDFRQGRSDVDPALGNNREELARIRGNILELLQNRRYDLDSIVISASCSPEGRLESNLLLSRQRAAAVADYFSRGIRHFRDSVREARRREGGFSLTLDASGREKSGTLPEELPPEIRFRSRSNGENWELLSLLVDQDSTLGPEAVRSYTKHLSISDLDKREAALQKEPYYRHLREALYPRLRTVKFDFFLHRKGMVKDTVHTTELDTTYMNGIAYLRDREYEKALSCLREYRDYNTAIAYVSLDYNASAMAILQQLERTPAVNYMLALVHARNGDDRDAVECYLNACRKDRSYLFRGNLDPEIYVLIQRYGLNREEETASLN